MRPIRLFRPIQLVISAAVGGLVSGATATATAWLIHLAQSCL